MENYLFLCDGMVLKVLRPILGNRFPLPYLPFPFIPNGIIPLCSPVKAQQPFITRKSYALILMDSTQYQHIPAYLHWHRKILTRLKQFIVANSFLDMPIWRERRSCEEVYHVHSFSSLLLFPCIASASTLSIQPSVSTLGVGVDISYRQNSFIAYRLSAFTQPFDTKIKLKGIQYKTEDSSHSVGLLLDIFPFKNAFRISAGAYYFKLDTDLSTSVDAINPIYEELINQTSGKATWERLAPYIGLGWERAQQSESSLGWHASLGPYL